MKLHVAVFVTSLAACGSGGTQQPAPVAPSQSPVPDIAPAAVAPVAPAAAACLDPIADGQARLAGAGVEPVANPPDLDGDGQPDMILRSPGAREPPHLLYVMAGPCGRFVGRVDAFMLGCDRRSTGMCDLWVETWLMHGDRLRSRWSFDGTRYGRIGEGELVPGPRKRP